MESVVTVRDDPPAPKSSLGKVFISYARLDQKFAIWLAESVRKHVDDVWIDSRIGAGHVWTQEIDDAIEACDTFVLVVSPRSRESREVNKELLEALNRKKDVIPALHETCGAWTRIADIQRIDFRGWPARGLAELLKKQPPPKEWWRPIAIGLARAGGVRQLLTLFALVVAVAAYWYFFSPSETHIKVADADATSLVLLVENEGGRSSTLRGGTWQIDFGELPLLPEKLDLEGGAKVRRIPGHDDVEVRLTVAQIPTKKMKPDGSAYSREEILRLIPQSTIRISGEMTESDQSTRAWMRPVSGSRVEPFITGAIPENQGGFLDEP